MPLYNRPFNQRKYLSTALAGATTLLLWSTPAAVQAQTITGFSGVTLNGGATVANNILTLTDGGTNQARSAFFNTKLNYSSGFNVSFTYTPSGYTGTAGADGIAFILQNSANGAAAVGSSGSGLGYGGMLSSAAIEFNIYTGHTVGTAFAKNGTTGTYTSASPIAFSSGSPINVTLVYNSTADSLSETLLDTVANTTYTTTYTSTGLKTAVGGTSAYAGFSGGTGGSVAIQKITNFSYTPSVNTPEPGSLSLAGMGLTTGLAGVVRGRRRKGKREATQAK